MISREIEKEIQQENKVIFEFYHATGGVSVSGLGV